MTYQETPEAAEARATLIEAGHFDACASMWDDPCDCGIIERVDAYRDAVRKPLLDRIARMVGDRPWPFPRAADKEGED